MDNLAEKILYDALSGVFTRIETSDEAEAKGIRTQYTIIRLSATQRKSGRNLTDSQIERAVKRFNLFPFSAQDVEYQGKIDEEREAVELKYNLDKVRYTPQYREINQLVNEEMEQKHVFIKKPFTGLVFFKRENSIGVPIIEVEKSNIIHMPARHSALTE